MESTPKRSDHSSRPSGDIAREEPWRFVDPATLKLLTVSFKCLKGIRPDQYVQSLESQGFGDILSLQLGLKGECRLTLGSRTSVEQILSKGFLVEGRHVLPQQGGSLARATQLHVHDVPIWISDSNVISVLTPYGKVLGDIRHGRKRLQSGAYMSTGVRFASFEQKPGTIPRTLRTSDGTHVFRVIREGDAPLCSNCQSYFHTTEECRKSKSDDSAKPLLEPVSRPARRWETSTSAAARARDSTSTSPTRTSTENATSESQREDNRASHTHDTRGEPENTSSPVASESEGDADEDSDAFESSCENLDSPPLKVNPLDSGSVTPTSVRPGQEDEGRALDSDSAPQAPRDQARAHDLLTTLTNNKFTPLQNVTSANTQESRKRKAPTISPDDAAGRREKKKARKQRKREKQGQSPQ